MNSGAYLRLETRNGRIEVSGTTSLTVRRGPQPVAANSVAEQPQSGCSTWDWNRQRLQVKTSQSGLVPIYYVRLQDGMAVSPSLVALRDLFSLEAIDWPAVALCLTLGHYIEDDTPFRDIRVVPLDCVLTWTPSKFDLTPRRRSIVASKEDYTSALGTYASLVRQAIARYPQSDASAMGLSGGRDSRHILLALLEQGRRPQRLVTCNHYLDFSSADTELAQMLARRLNLAITVAQPPRNRIIAEISKNQITEFQTRSHSWGLGLSQALAGMQTLYDGMNGGTLFGRSPMVRALSRQAGESLPAWSLMAETCVALQWEKPLARLQGLLEPSLFTADVLAAARARLLTCLEKYRRFPNPLQAFRYFEHVTRDTSLFTYKLMTNAEIRCPLDDPTVVNWALGLPWKVTSRAEFQAEALRKCYPAFADVPFVAAYQPRAKETYFDEQAQRESLGRLQLQWQKHPVGLSRTGLERLKAGGVNWSQIPALILLAQTVALAEGHNPVLLAELNHAAKIGCF